MTEAAIPLVGIEPARLVKPRELDWEDDSLARRVARFRVPVDVLTRDIKLWRQIMSYCLVTRCELYDCDRSFEFIVRSPLLETVSQMDMIPDVMLVLWQHPSGTDFRGFRGPPAQ